MSINYRQGQVPLPDLRHSWSRYLWLLAMLGGILLLGLVFLATRAISNRNRTSQEGRLASAALSFQISQTGVDAAEPVTALAGDGTFYVRIRGRAETAVSQIRSAVAQVDPELPVTLTIFDDQVERSLRTERMLASLSSAFGTFALLLAVIGLYGVMAFVVTQRTQEIALRMALGATRPAALWLIMRDAAVMLAGGTLIALPAVWALRRFVEAELFGVTSLHLPTIAVAAAVLAVVGFSAALLPAWRAATVNPTEALRL